MSRSVRILIACLAGLSAITAARAHADLDTQLHEASRRVYADPGDARAWLHRAELYRMRQLWDEAESDYRQAERFDPRLDVVDLFRGRMFVESGRPVQALAALRRYLGAHPRSVEALVWSARARRTAGDPPGAVADWNAALAAAHDEDARPAYFLERADAVLAADASATAAAVEGLIEGYRRLGGAASLSARIRELDPSRALPQVAPEAETMLPGPAVFATTLTRGPYLQMGTPTSVVVRWRTGGATNGVVRYGPSPASLTATATQASVTTEHVVGLTGLSPNTRYYYSVGSSTEVIAGGTTDYAFVTAPALGTTKPFRVWVLGDSGTANANAAAVRDAYATFTGTRATDFWMMLGDNAYEVGSDANYKAAVFDMYPAMLRKSVLWPAYGNHDGASADSDSETGPYYDIFSLPRAAEAGGVPSGSEAYYSFDYGNVHFICLDSFESSRAPAGDMLTWLAQDLSATTKDWIIAFWHHPPYSKGSHDSDTEPELIDMRQNANPILEAHGVDLVLSGHSHSYERSYLIDGHYNLSSTFNPDLHLRDPGSGNPLGTGPYEKPALGPDPHEGTVYTVAGSSGQISGGALNHPAMYKSLNVLGSMVLDFSGNRLDAKFLGSNGVIRDAFAIIKEGSLLPQTDFDGAPRTGPAPLAVTFTDKTLNGPIAWSWDLDGDASSDSSAQNPSRVYATPGRYTVSLSATNVAGSQQTTKTAFVCVTAAAPPGTVSGLTFAANRTLLTWGATALAASYDVVRGNLATLRSSRGSFAASTTGCLENDGGDQTSSDPATPLAGAGFWYLARGSDCAGRPGSYNDGTQSAGRDAGIIAAPSTCP